MCGEELKKREEELKKREEELKKREEELKRREGAQGEIMTASGRLTREGTALPEEAMPWGHHAIKVKGKSYVILAARG